MAWSQLDLPVASGEVIDGKYRVERLIGAGGMGCVVEATHLQLLRPVAMKFLLVSEEGPEAATRLVREARAAVALQSDHVARVLDVGTLPSGMPYLVMEYLRGMTLSQLLSGGARLAPEDARRIAIETCLALGEAHRRGIVHRDVKPANIFLANLEDGTTRVKVLDFGIAKVTDPHMAVDPQLTSTEHTLGTPRYMAPEQLSATRDVDARADVWAMGVVLYECLVGSPPFGRGGTAFEIGARVLVETAPRVSASLPEITPELDEIVARCLERERGGRFRDADELLAALEGKLHLPPKTRAGLGPLRSTVQLPPPVSLPPTMPKQVRVPALSSAPSFVPTPAPSEANKPPPTGLIVGFSAVAVLMIIAGVATLLTSTRQREEPSAAASPATTASAPTSAATPTEPTPQPAVEASTTPLPAAQTSSAASAHAPTKRAPSPAPKPPAITRPPNER